MASLIAGHTQAQRDRLAFIELRVRFTGEVRRQDLVGRFGIQVAAATRDLALYKDIAPHNLGYDGKSKAYVRGSWFRPVFEFSAERVLVWLSQGFGDAEPLRVRSVVASENPRAINAPDLETIATISRAICRKSALEITYRSVSDGLTTREVVPFALADVGNRWLVRAFDRRERAFRHFVLPRIVDARMLSGLIADHETSDQDSQWNRIVDLELVPHPANVRHPDTIEAEYGMTDGVLNTRVRAAMAGYLLRHWNVDCTTNHSLKDSESHLWLRNRLALYGVANIELAPGYESTDATLST
jgi:predicted DNA-binding transcriptional regulator YafY